MNFGGALAGIGTGLNQFQQQQQEQQRAAILQQIAKAQLADRLRQQQQAAGGFQVAQTPDFTSMLQQAQAMPTQLPAGGILGDQTTAPAPSPSGGGLNPAFASRLDELMAAGKAAGVPLSVASGYRTPERQAQLYASDEAEHGGSPSGMVAPPGRSMHERGLAADLSSSGGLIRGGAADQFIGKEAPMFGLTRPMAKEPWHVELGPETAQAVATAAPAVAAQIPPGVAGKVGKEGLAQLIQRTLPDAPDDVKFGIFQSLSGVLAPAEKQQVAVMMAELKGQIQQQLKDTETPAQKAEVRIRQGELAERTRHDRVTEAAAATRQQGSFPPDVINMLADQAIAGDTSWKTNLGRGQQGAANIAAVDARIAEKAKEQGLTGKDLAVRAAEFGGLKAGERTLTTRTAQIGMRINEARQFAPLALNASENVDRTQYPTFNRLYEAGLTGTGDENVVRLAVATNSFLNAYAAAVTPTGTPTEGAQTRARAILDDAWSKGQFRTGIDQLLKELDAAQKSPGVVREEFRRGTDPGQSANPAGPSATTGGAGGWPVPPGHENDPDGSVYNNGKFIKRGNQIIPNAGSAPANP